VFLYSNNSSDPYALLLRSRGALEGFHEQTLSYAECRQWSTTA
jgi:hypothetical protein